MKYRNKKSSKKYQYDPNNDYDEGDRRRGRTKKEARERKEKLKENPPEIKKDAKIIKPIKKPFVYNRNTKTQEELSAIKTAFVKKFNEQRLLTKNQSNTGCEDDETGL